MDPRNFQNLVEQYYAELYRFAFSLARNGDDASDLTQQTFAIFARKGDDLRDPAKCKSWLFTTLYREFLKEASRSKRIVSMDGEDASPGDLAVSNIPSPSRTAEHHEALEALASLEESHRSVLSLFYLDHCPYHEIAEILGVPIGTVMSRISRAKEALRERLHVMGRKNRE
jgi:RNA polymerase sigma-70 factor (ECF subfamily)